MKIGVLVSGTGTNLQALLDAQTRGALAPAEIAIVIANKPGVQALDRAAAAAGAGDERVRKPDNARRAGPRPRRGGGRAGGGGPSRRLRSGDVRDPPARRA